MDTWVSLGSLTAPAEGHRLLPGVPVHKLDRSPERPGLSSLSDGRPSIEQLPCFRERASMQAGVPQSLDKDYAEDRKPMELVPPSGTESNCWCPCHQHLILLSLHPPPLSSLKQRPRASRNQAAVLVGLKRLQGRQGFKNHI